MAMRNIANQLVRNDAQPITQWALKNAPTANAAVLEHFWQQIFFVRDELPNCLGNSLTEAELIRSSIMVVGSYCADNGIDMPVYNVPIPNGPSFTMAGYDSGWSVSVAATREVEADFMGLFDPQEKKALTVGFPPDLVFGPYAENTRNFTFQIANGGTYHLFVFLYYYLHKSM